MTTNKTYCIDDPSVYPGQYEPLPGKENELREQLERSGQHLVAPPATIKEMDNYYSITMNLPHFTRDDFFVYTRGLVLTIMAMKNRKKGQGRLPGQKLNCFCFKRDIVLPADADPELVTANYQNSVLTIWLYKNGHPIRDRRQNRIVVY